MFLVLKKKSYLHHWTHRAPVWGDNSWGPKEHCISQDGNPDPHGEGREIRCGLRQMTLATWCLRCRGEQLSNGKQPGVISARQRAVSDSNCSKVASMTSVPSQHGASDIGIARKSEASRLAELPQQHALYGLGQLSLQSRCSVASQPSTLADEK